MRKYLQMISPRRAVGDFVEHWKQPQPHRWQILGVACALTFAIFMLFMPESQRGALPRPEVTYITTWDDTRTREEIVASNIEHQKRKDEIAALLEQRAELRKDMYRELGRATGLDVDAMEAKIKADEAAEAARKAAVAPPLPRPRVPSNADTRWLAAAASLAVRARPLSRPNPAVAAILVKDDRVVGRGWTQAGGRPHAEAIALDQAGNAARGATLYVTLEPCAHDSTRGPACADLAAAAGLARVVVGTSDPDPRTAGQGIARLRGAGFVVELANDPACEQSLVGYLYRARLGRPHVTLKLAMSLDGCIALASGESRWITGPEARAHVHRQRALADAILVGGGTWRADRPGLDVRLSGLAERSPQRVVLTRGVAPDGVKVINAPDQITRLDAAQYLYVEGGAQTAASFLAADLVDTLHIYRAPILIGGGLPALADIGLASLAQAHGRWQHTDTRRLGSDVLDVYVRTPAQG